MNRKVPLILALMLAACLSGANASAETSADIAASPAAVPAGTYRLDRAHASLIFRVNHLGFSNYTARFTQFDAELRFDPDNPTASVLTATVDPKSIETDFPDPATLDFNAKLQNEQWLDTARFPDISYRSTAVEPAGPDRVRVTGDLSLHGVTRPVVLEVIFNGGYAGHPLDPHARIGFSARGALLRSRFGVAFGIPQPGSSLGVSDLVEIIIEAEFSGPDWAPAEPAMQQ